MMADYIKCTPAQLVSWAKLNAVSIHGINLEAKRGLKEQIAERLQKAGISAPLKSYVPIEQSSAAARISTSSSSSAAAAAVAAPVKADLIVLAEDEDGTTIIDGSENQESDRSDGEENDK